MRPLIGLFTLRGVVSRAAAQIRQKTVDARVITHIKPEALHRSVEEGDAKKVEYILSLGANPHEPSQDDNITALDIVRERIKSPPDNARYKEIARLIKDNDRQRFEDRLVQHKIRDQEIRESEARYRYLTQEAANLDPSVYLANAKSTNLGLESNKKIPSR